MSVFEKPPQEYRFDDADADRYRKSFAPMTTSYVLRYDHAGLWKLSRSAPSLLPILMLEVYPAKLICASIQDRVNLPHPSGGWTVWGTLSNRRLARFAGLNKGTIKSGFEALSKSGCCESEVVNCRGSEGGRKRYYRLRNDLFGSVKSGYAPIHGTTIYGGTWALLTPAARQLHVAIAATDPIYAESQFLAADEHDDPRDRVERIRGKTRITWAELQDYTGLGNSALADALSMLRRPIFGGGKVALVKCEDSPTHRPRWYARDERAWRDGWKWSADWLNSKPINDLRREVWPELQQRWNQRQRAAKKQLRKRGRAE